MKAQLQRGYTLVEVLFTTGIFVLILSAIVTFQIDIFSFNDFISVGLENQNEAKRIIKPFANEVRGAVSSEVGGYAIKQADADTFIFYSDIDGDDLIEEVRYYFEDGTFKKGVITPSGDPLTYESNDEDIVEVVHGVVSSDIFEYYDSSYTGASTTESLGEDSNISDVRLVKITLRIDSDPEEPPAEIEVTTQVSIRNLKDNL